MCHVSVNVPKAIVLSQSQRKRGVGREWGSSLRHLVLQGREVTRDFPAR